MICGSFLFLTSNNFIRLLKKFVLADGCEKTNHLQQDWTWLQLKNILFLTTEY
jgi:hypothetical protein